MIAFNSGIIYLAHNAIQSGIVHFESSNAKLFETICKVKSVLMALNIASIIWSLKQCVDIVDKTTNLYLLYAAPTTQIADLIGVLIGGGSLIAVVTWIALAAKVVKRINNHFKPTTDLGIWPNGTVKWSNPSHQKWMQGFYITQIAMSVALTFFSGAPLLFGLSAACQIYSLIKTAQWKWIRFDRKWDLPPIRGDGPLSYTVSYFCSAWPAKRKENEECPICLEDEEPTTTQFCSNHSFHDKCIVGHINSKSDQFLSNLKSDDIVRNLVKEPQNNGIVREYITYKINLPKNNVPSCPLCRGQPTQNEINITVQDQFRWQKQNISASVILV